MKWSKLLSSERFGTLPCPRISYEEAKPFQELEPKPEDRCRVIGKFVVELIDFDDEWIVTDKGWIPAELYDTELQVGDILASRPCKKTVFCGFWENNEPYLIKEA